MADGNSPAKLKAEAPAPLDPLAKLREPFLPNQVSKLPKETGKQRDERLADQKAGKWLPKCSICDGYHHPRAVHLDYVGHAALTDRLLDVDPLWSWEPVAFAPDGLPAFDRNGGLWIKLTVCGVTRLGYGNAEGKTGGDAVKEIIGDALRNAAMRFGAALDLWHKGDLHAHEESSGSDSEEIEEAPAPERTAVDLAIQLLRGCKTPEEFKEAWGKNFEGWKQVMDDADYRRVQAVKVEMVAKLAPKTTTAARLPPKQSPPPQQNDFGIGEDEIPY